VSGHRTTVDQRELVLRRHLNSIGSVPELTPEEELTAAAVVADGRSAENELAALAGAPMLDLDAIARLRDRVRHSDLAREHLIASCRPLVVTLARRHQATAGVTAILLSAGDDALVRAVDRYDPTGGLPFSSFARWWVERAMRDVERNPSGRSQPEGTDTGTGTNGRHGHAVIDTTLLTALGHLHQDDCRILELRLGLDGGPGLSAGDAAMVLGLDADDESEREEKALAKLRHPSTPGDLTHLRQL
jgi:DNA-directed RNA polymerase sigma subunit (sigma70/sigma32)